MKMDFKFKILDIDLSQHSIVVRYYTDKITEDNLATSFNSDGSIMRKDDGSPVRCQTDYNLNIWKTNPPPTEEEIIKYINDCFPYEWFKLKYDVLDENVDTSLSSIKNIMNKEFKSQVDKTQQQDVKESKPLSDDEIEQLLEELTKTNS